LYWHGKKLQVQQFGVLNAQVIVTIFIVLLKLYSAARNASPIETGMKHHALAHSEGGAGAGVEVEV